MSNFASPDILVVKTSKFLRIDELDVSDSSRQLEFIELSKFLDKSRLTSRDQMRMVESREALMNKVLSGCSQRLLTIRLWLLNA